MDKLKELFVDFIEKVPSFGKSFICIDDKNNNEIIKKIKIKNYYTYGTSINSQFRIRNIEQSKEFSKFNVDIKLPGKKDLTIKNIIIPLLGLHNIRNATAAIAVATTLGISKYLLIYFTRLPAPSPKKSILLGFGFNTNPCTIVLIYFNAKAYG